MNTQVNSNQTQESIRQIFSSKKVLVKVNRIFELEILMNPKFLVVQNNLKVNLIFMDCERFLS